MEKPSILFTGVFGAFLLSTTLMVLLPHSQLSGLQPSVGDWDGSTPNPADVYPVKMEGGEGTRLGQRAYMEHGCFYCHSQQVRDFQYGPDMERGWGSRRTVARDYLYEEVPLLGSTRLGPDFANYGWLGEGKDAAGNPVKVHMWRNEPTDDPKKPLVRNEAWIYQHLFNPRILNSDSNCPPMPHLFELADTGAAPSPNAVGTIGNRQIIPIADARYLAAYLLSLNRTHDLNEAPTMIKPKEAKK